MTARQPTISAVVVSFNVADLLRACLASLEAERAAGNLDEIIVIDSSSTDGSVRLVQDHFPDVCLQVVPNRGFGSAVNVGLALASSDAIFILNPDTVVCPGAVARLSRALYSANNIGLVGPRLRYPDGTNQSSRRRFPTAWTPVFESTIFEEWFPSNRWVRHYRMLDEPGQHPESVDWLVGAALMVRSDVVQQAGGFDESFWLYGEELEWCHRIGRHGWEIHCVPEAIVVHHEAASTSQDQLASRLEFDRGRIRVQRIIHGDRAARRTAWMLKLNFASQLLREGLKWIVGHRRDLRRQRVARYWTLLRSDLND
ncbi:glycosyltransferase family 2 protein [soil metagenome]